MSKMPSTHRVRDPLAAVGAGRFDAGAHAVVARLQRAARTQNVCMMTEVTPEQWRVVKTKLPVGWAAVHLNEFLIAWDNEVQRPVGTKARWTWITKGFFNRGRIQIRAKVGELRLAYRAFDDPGCYYSVVHLPAHIQQGDHYTSDPERQDEVRAHQEALATLGRRGWRRRHKHPERRQCLTGDVNVDLMRPTWRAETRRTLMMEGVWRAGNLPAHGDLGQRLIVGVWTYGFGENQTNGLVLPTPLVEDGLDHRLVETWS